MVALIVSVALSVGVAEESALWCEEVFDRIEDWALMDQGEGVSPGDLDALRDDIEASRDCLAPAPDPEIPEPEPPPPPQAAEPAENSPQPRSVSAPQSVEGWRGLVAAYFASGDVNTALCLMAHESGGDPGARNPSSGASGLFQVMPFWAPEFGVSRDALFDPVVNTRIAASIKDMQGWGAWSPYNRGECR